MKIVELKDFPRPQIDTGIGVEWSFGYPAAIGLERLRQRWIPMLRAMGISWVKLRHLGGEELARHLLEQGIMPIVQLWRLRPYPGPLSSSQVKALKDYIAAGVRYFELAEPLDRPQAWKDGRVPDRALAAVLPHLVGDIQTVLDAGGLPGLPATRSLASEWDIIGALGEAGHEDILSAGVWQAYQIMAGNLPLDFPHDPVHLTGRPLSEDEYRHRAREAWAGSAWGGNSREEINAERQRRRDPDADLAKTPLGWRRHEMLDAQIRRHLGRSIPLLGTSGGCFVGERTDRRYVAVSPLVHSERILELARIMMGTSKEFPLAPGYLFCAAFSVLGNYALGHFEPSVESMAWLGPRLPGGRLPVVDALRDEPKRSRWGEGMAGTLPPLTAGSLPLVVSDWESPEAALRPIGLRATPEGAERETELVQPAVGRPLSQLLSPGAWEGEEGPAALLDSAESMPETTPDGKAPWPLATIVGKLTGGKGMTAIVRSESDGSTTAATVARDGTFAFRNLQPGTYELSVDGTDLSVHGINLAAGTEHRVSLTMPEWMWRTTVGQDGKGFSIVRCSVTGQSGMPVRIWSSDWEGLEALTGTRPEYGPYYCELAPLAAGRYTLKPEGLDISATLDLDGDSVLYVEFVPVDLEEAEETTGEEVASEEPSMAECDKGFERYLLLARPFASKEDLLAVLHFIRVRQPVCGFSVQEAQWARDILIVGSGTLRVTTEDERRLKERGCRVQRIERDIAQTMMQLATAGESSNGS